jgi:hypothetical protein
MSDHVVVVACPSCSQKYRVSRSAFGQKARCAKCKNQFVVGTRKAFDEDTILSWIAESDSVSDADPASESVMGSTGLFRAPRPAVATESSAAPPQARIAAHRHTSGLDDGSPPRVRVSRIDTEGAHFEFPASALAGEALRDSFPRKCVGCAGRHGLWVHLVYWPDRMSSQEAVHWKDYQNAAVGDWDQFARAGGGWLKRIPRPRHSKPPFDEPFPFLTCRHCQAAAQVQGRAPTQGGECTLTVRSLATAVDFYRHNGGRHTPEYQRLIEQRDLRHDRRNELCPEVRNRLSHWFTPLPGEQFVRYFPDAEFSPAEAGTAGAVLTVRRLVFKKFAAFRDYSLHLPCRMEIKSTGPHAQLHVFEEGHRPAVLALSESDANQLVLALRSLSCRWSISR